MASAIVGVRIFSVAGTIPPNGGIGINLHESQPNGPSSQQTRIDHPAARFAKKSLSQCSGSRLRTVSHGVARVGSIEPTQARLIEEDRVDGSPIKAMQNCARTDRRQRGLGRGIDRFVDRIDGIHKARPERDQTERRDIELATGEHQQRRHCRIGLARE